MTLYAADIMDLAKPVKGKGKKKAEPITPPASEADVPMVKEKKPRTEKQIAALEKAKAARAAKKAEKEAEKAKAAEEAARAPAPLKEPKQRKPRKPKAPVEAPQLEPIQASSVEPIKEKKPRKRKEPTVEEQVDKAVEQVIKPKRVRKVKNPDEPPAWVPKFLEQYVQQRAAASDEKLSKKQIKEEAEHLAQEKWKDGMIRDKVRAEQDNHTNRLFSQMFGRR